jgi:hypothetical protein
MQIVFCRALTTGATFALATLITAAASAQTAPSPSPQTGAQPQRTIQMVPAVAQLDKSLDTKKAKQGDPVTAKLEQAVQIPNAQALPKNTVLEGHVDQVQASDHRSDSTMTVTFDKAKLKSGQELPIKATVVAVAVPAQQQQAGGGSAPSAGPSAMPSAGGGGGAPSGGGSMGGGSSNAAPPQQPMDVPQSASGPSQPTQNQGVPGVMLKSDIHDPSSATFSSKGMNVHVPDGTQMQFALTVIPAGVRIQ